ncbi:MAG: TlpA family protein disulfide reductase [bacterium]|nr:TlpA family protein disulfide reductase [bacterium]
MILRALCINTVWIGLLLASSTSSIFGKPKSAPATLQEIGADWSDSNQVAGKVVYLDFFASWCTPCALSFPFMKELSRTYADSGLQIIAIDLDKDSSEATIFLERMRPPFKIVMDPEGNLAKRYDLKAVPSSFIYGRDGTLRELHQGFVSADTTKIRAEIVALLKEPRKP